jgi:hypothetical protein
MCCGSCVFLGSLARLFVCLFGVALLYGWFSLVSVCARPSQFRRHNVWIGLGDGTSLGTTGEGILTAGWSESCQFGITSRSCIAVWNIPLAPRSPTNLQCDVVRYTRRSLNIDKTSSVDRIQSTPRPPSSSLKTCCIIRVHKYPYKATTILLYVPMGTRKCHGQPWVPIASDK